MKTKPQRVAEAIIFIWIAQHAAFSDASLKVDDFLSIKSADIDPRDLIIQIGDHEICITTGLKDILLAWIDNDQIIYQNSLQGGAIDQVK